MKKIVGFSFVLFFLLIVIAGCQKRVNSVFNYLNNAELQYENEDQMENIKVALNDILTLPEKELSLKKYKDYTGEEGQWDLPTLILRHFVPDKKGKSLGLNFYKDVKSDEVQKKISMILKTLE